MLTDGTPTPGCTRGPLAASSGHDGPVRSFHTGHGTLPDRLFHGARPGPEERTADRYSGSRLRIAVYLLPGSRPGRSVGRLQPPRPGDRALLGGGGYLDAGERHLSG